MSFGNPKKGERQQRGKKPGKQDRRLLPRGQTATRFLEQAGYCVALLGAPASYPKNSSVPMHES